MVCEIKAASSASAGVPARKSGSAIEIRWILRERGGAENRARMSDAQQRRHAGRAADARLAGVSVR